jgi:hypothetical protein
MITDIRGLTNAEERREILNHLFDSPVWWLACDVKAGRRRLLKGRIVSVEFLGNSKTIFGDLGGVDSNDIFGVDKFLVRQLSETLNRPECRDTTSRDSLQGLLQALAQQQISPRITLDRDANVIADGNKTAAAFYELHKHDVTIDLDIYLSE